MVPLQLPSSPAAQPTLSFPTLRTGTATEHLAPGSKQMWSIDFICRSTDINRRLQSHSISLVARAASAKWHVRVTFLGGLCHTSQKIGQKSDWPKRWRDFRALCCCIDFNLLSLLDDKFTELFISAQPDLCSTPRLLPLKGLPKSDSDYAAFRGRPLVSPAGVPQVYTLFSLHRFGTHDIPQEH